ncbi:MAG: hypothetical protein JW910_12645 [Anaerolineae bacterium]|nr:hypothetical protein [Anaerolineae bacterium]
MATKIDRRDAAGCQPVMLADRAGFVYSFRGGRGRGGAESGQLTHGEHLIDAEWRDCGLRDRYHAD